MFLVFTVYLSNCFCSDRLINYHYRLLYCRFTVVFLSNCFTVDLMALDIQLQNYIVDMQSNDMFLELNGIDELARKMIETQKDVTYLLLYLLVKLDLTLPVATAAVERSFSAMKHIKNALRNRMGDQWMNDCLVT